MRRTFYSVFFFYYNCTIHCLLQIISTTFIKGLFDLPASYLSKILIIIFYSSKENKVKDNQDYLSRSNFQTHPQTDLFTKVTLCRVFSHIDDIWVTKIILYLIHHKNYREKKIKTIKDCIHMLDSNLTLSSSEGIFIIRTLCSEGQ